MAIKLKDGGEDLGVSSDINVTPFIDVTLVLLIIFMVAAPLSTVDVPVDLPTSNAAAQARPDKPIYLTVKHDLSLAIGETAVRPEELQARLDAETGGDREKRIFLRGDKGLAYGDLMGVMNDLRDAGYLKIALVGLEGGGAPPAPAPTPGASP